MRAEPTPRVAALGSVAAQATVIETERSAAILKLT